MNGSQVDFPCVFRLNMYFDTLMQFIFIQSLPNQTAYEMLIFC